VTAIFGIGNLLMGDDGIGPAVARYLETHYEFLDVVIEDLGTPGLDLPSYLMDHDRVIFIDAVAADAPPGSIVTYTREEIVAVAPGIRISPHEPTINDALLVLDFAGKAPSEVTLIGVVPERVDGGVGLSDVVAAAIPIVAEVIAALVEDSRPRLYASIA
jgi:hydrogenase maturation protease